MSLAINTDASTSLFDPIHFEFIYLKPYDWMNNIVALLCLLYIFYRMIFVTGNISSEAYFAFDT